nr:hypothetical protein [uncultured Mediterraneibacter sp.]
MNKNSGHIFRIVAGIYLIYLGVKILMDVTRKQPSNMVFMAVMSVIFIVIGALYAGTALKKMLGISFKKKGQMQDTASLDTEEVNRQFQSSSDKDAENKKSVMTEAGPEKKSADDATADTSGETKDDEKSEKKDTEAKEEASDSKMTEESKDASEKEEKSEEKSEAEKDEKSSSEEAEEEVVQLEEIAEDEEPVSEEAENDFEEK